MRFAKELTAMYPDLVDSACGKGTLPEKLPPALESFRQMTNEGSPGLEHARLWEVFNYLRRGKFLVIPREWQPYISKADSAVYS